MSEGSESSSKEWVLEPETEYRFELDPGTSLAIKHVTGQPSTEYVSEETPMAVYGNLHIAIEQMRVRALAKFRGSPEPEGRPAPDLPTEPPRVLVLGPDSAGKTTLCKILINYTVRAGQAWSPLLINVDPSEASSSRLRFSIQTLTSFPREHGQLQPASDELPVIPAGLGRNLRADHFGIECPSATCVLSTTRNPLLMDRLIRNLGVNVDEKSSNDPKGQTAGLIVDTPSSFASGTAATNEHRQKLIKACVDAFKINIILVVGHEKLNVEMQRTYGPTLKVVKVPKSGGVVELDHGYRERVHDNQFHTYMYGEVITPPLGISGGTQGGEALADLTLAPSSTVVSFNDLTIYRIGAGTMAPSSALPVGASRSVSEMQPVLIDPSIPGSGLLNAILAVLAPFNPDENERYDEEILDLPVIGFIAVTHIDIAHKKLTVLSPTQGSLVGKTAVIGSYEWQE
ncbi:Cleavage polyadenylation factor subunit clp1 [Marasmius crinis-equi]|uniref:Polynucleotide 5'-hydroxyl-kinase GRC3 n=1 Tax=Marasmius crinis-equi TaxID=585013 RepID=A0ABR3FHL1_9AGAR